MSRADRTLRAEELIESSRAHEALTLANRCLKERATGSEARLRAVRSLALWLAGDAGPALREAERARRIACPERKFVTRQLHRCHCPRSALVLCCSAEDRGR